MDMDEATYNSMQTLGEEINRELERAVRAGDQPCWRNGKEADANAQKVARLHMAGVFRLRRIRGLAQMYVADYRFTEYYDKSVSGCAQFLCDAINTFAE